MGIAEFIEARAAERKRAVTDHLCINCGKPTLPLRSDLGVTGYIHDRALGGWDGIRCPSRLTGAAPLQDPDRALREIAATRAILAEHRPRGLFTATCPTCLDDGRDETTEAATQTYPCSTLRALAATDSGHPDYEPSWAPEQVSA